MINIANFKVLKGYEHWKTVFMKEDFVKLREEAGVNILAKGFDAQNEAGVKERIKRYLLVIQALTTQSIFC